MKDDDEAHRRGRGYLPHWERVNATYFVTFRLAGALPRHVAEHLMAERQDLERRLTGEGGALPRSQRAHVSAVIARRMEEQLDAGEGDCFLARPEIADVVANALAHFDGDRYLLTCWCIMPNHVHVVVQPLAGQSLARVVHSWKSFTANAANRLLRRTGEFWQREYYDHLVRDERDFVRIIRYVLGNPAKAGLHDWRWVYVRADAAPDGG